MDKAIKLADAKLRVITVVMSIWRVKNVFFGKQFFKISHFFKIVIYNQALPYRCITQNIEFKAQF